MHALGSMPAGSEVTNALNSALSQAAQDLFCIPAVIVAAHTSTTTDFGVLAVGDIVIHVPAVAGNSIFWTVAVAGTLPAAAVVGDLYVVLRAFSPPANDGTLL